MNQPGKRNDPYHIWKTAIDVTQWIGSPLSVVIHTLIFIGCFIAAAEGLIVFEDMLLILTTIVSLEAIYLSIFIQMTINYTTQELAEVGEDIEELQENVGELQENVEEISEDVVDISEEVEETNEEEAAEESRKATQQKALVDIQTDLRKLMQDIERLQKNHLPSAE